MDEILWPLRGVLLFLRSPRWWLRPMLGMVLAMGALFGIGIGIAWWLWPLEHVTGVWWWLYAGMAIGLAVASVVIAWALFLPLLMSFLLEDLARKANAYAKEHVPVSSAAPALAGAGGGFERAESQELATMPGILASLKVLGGTLPVRLGWMGTSLITGLIIAPLGVVVSALGMGHIACIDAIDISLGLRGFNGRQRLEALKAHRNEVRQSALSAALLHLGLTASVVGWVFWLPGIVVGAALRTRSWNDTRNDVPAATTGGSTGP
jgi:hypothetical protein